MSLKERTEPPRGPGEWNLAIDSANKNDNSKNVKE
jgi:hypothetical protein